MIHNVCSSINLRKSQPFFQCFISPTRMPSLKASLVAVNRIKLQFQAKDCGYLVFQCFSIHCFCHRWLKPIDSSGDKKLRPASKSKWKPAKVLRRTEGWKNAFRSLAVQIFGSETLSVQGCLTKAQRNKNIHGSPMFLQLMVEEDFGIATITAKLFKTGFVPWSIRRRRCLETTITCAPKAIVPWTRPAARCQQLIDSGTAAGWTWRRAGKTHMLRRSLWCSSLILWYVVHFCV